MDPRLTAAVLASKLSSTAIRRLGRGGGTATPGLIANVIDPGVMNKLSSQLRAGCIVVAGTNGKTTTSRMLAGILEHAGLRVIHNRSGSNLVRGISAALTSHSSITGRPSGDIAVIETDEAAVPEVVARTRPRLIVLLNLFRDQLDRYGELDTIARNWQTMLRSLSSDQTVLINGDDPALTAITENMAARRISFGFHSRQHILEELPHAADSGVCRKCGAALIYHSIFLSHLGDYECPNCDLKRPELDYAATDIQLTGLDSLRVTVDSPGRNDTSESHTFDVSVPGLYNAYNVLAAVAATMAIGTPGSVARESLTSFTAAFGRIERVEYRGRRLVLVLIKNPVGFNEVLRTLAMTATGQPTLIIINDLDADGRDVSWLWDVDVEQLAGVDTPLYTAGIRGGDMAVRLKYAGVPSAQITPLGPLAGAFDRYVETIPEGGTGYILPTYTAMLELRAMLADAGAVEAFWEQ